MPLQRRTSNLRLRALLAEARWSQDALARSVNALAAQQGLRTHYDRTSVSHWLAGSRPRPPMPELIREAFTRRLGRTVTSLDTGIADHGDLAAFWFASAQDDAVVRLATLTGAEGDPVHRAAVRALHYSPSVLAPQWTSPAVDGGAADEDPSPRGQAMQEMGRLYVFHLEAFGGGHARSGLASYLAQDVSQWLRTDSAGPRALFAGAAQLTHLLALAAADMGAEGQAQGYHQTAMQLAAEVDDRAMYAVSLRALSAQALRTGHPGPAESLARSAIDAAPPDASPALRAYLHAQSAVCLARTGARKAAVAALTEAERNVENGCGHSDGNDDSPFSAYAPADFTYQKAMALTALGERGPALRALQTSLRSRGPTRSRSRALTRARLAELHLLCGNLEAAVAHWHTLLDEAAQLNSQQVQSRLAHMRQELQPLRRSPVVGDLLARAIEFSTRTDHQKTH
ncbi:hypothetical protein P2Q00_06765 [Streptomyces coacervatus]|uniref:hypothetical protein n=1 Tax=Streptomyces coacervatus TaxID=647381 RepID=UPI0023DA5B16|nr:hypothetical protein [Streptomyces coacervatus]MDF2265144.1 hypothetical protein [Streptomyces coacervatus]